MKPESMPSTVPASTEKLAIQTTPDQIEKQLAATILNMPETNAETAPVETVINNEPTKTETATDSTTPEVEDLGASTPVEKTTAVEAPEIPILPEEPYFDHYNNLGKSAEVPAPELPYSTPKMEVVTKQQEPEVVATPEESSEKLESNAEIVAEAVEKAENSLDDEATRILKSTLGEKGYILYLVLLGFTGASFLALGLLGMGDADKTADENRLIGKTFAPTENMQYVKAVNAPDMTPESTAPTVPNTTGVDSLLSAEK